MEYLLPIVVALLLVIFALLARLRFLRRAAREITEAFEDRLTADTNTLITTSSRDPAMCALANALNRQLRTLRRQQNRYLSGDQELKDAVTNISHDLRTPLTAICGYLELLEREPQSDAARRYLSIIAGRTAAMKALTEELFRYSVIASAPDALELSEVSVSRALEESIAGHYAALSSRGITPEIELPAAPVVRMLNRAALLRIFGNLLANAARHSDGDLSIRLSPDGQIVFSNMASGLDEVQVGKLFDRFYTVESARQSTGLGLSIAKILTEQMNGQIDADYAKGRLSIRLKF